MSTKGFGLDCKPFRKLFMYIKNNLGPRMFPYRMSTFTFLKDDN